MATRCATESLRPETFFFSSSPSSSFFPFFSSFPKMDVGAGERARGGGEAGRGGGGKGLGQLQLVGGQNV